MPHKHKFMVRPLFLQVRDELASRIANGEWKAGGLLPNEHALAAEFGVSTGTARKALDLLESEKIVSRRQGRGTFVVDHDTEEMDIRFSSIFKDLEQRIAGHVVWCEATFADPTPSEQRALAIGPTEKVLRAQRVREYHDHPFMYEELALVARYCVGLTEKAAEESRISTLAQKFGLQLSHAVERVSPVMCPPELVGKLGLDEPVPILKLERTVFKMGGVPLEFRTGWCHLREKQYISVTN